jgi:acetyl-CoA carboxylase/biotin carboxylase 1
LDGEKRFVDLLGKGQLPPRALLKMQHDIELILSCYKYKLTCTRSGPSSVSISLTGSSDNSVVTNVRTLSDGGYLVDIGGISHVAYLTTKGDAGTGMRLNVGGANIAFSPDYDPTSLRTDVAGKLVKKLKQDGAKVKKGEPYAEIEVMKMYMPLKVEESGVLSWRVNEGASLAAGDLLATLELENPENVSHVSVFEGNLAVAGWGATGRSPGQLRPHLLFRSAMGKLEAAMSGFKLSNEEIASAFTDLGVAVTNPMLPVYEIQEQLSVLSGRIPTCLFGSISSILSKFSSSCETKAGTGIQLR